MKPITKDGVIFVLKRFQVVNQDLTVSITQHGVVYLARLSVKNVFITKTLLCADNVPMVSIKII